MTEPATRQLFRIALIKTVGDVYKILAFEEQYPFHYWQLDFGGNGWLMLARMELIIRRLKTTDLFDIQKIHDKQVDIYPKDTIMEKVHAILEK